MAFALISRSRQSTRTPAKAARLKKPGLSHRGIATPHRFSALASRPQTAFPQAPMIQAKLKIGARNDRYEQEADRVADQVIRMSRRPLQHACACGGGCPKCRKEQGDHEQLQTKRAQAHDAGKTTAPPIVQKILSSPGLPMDRLTRGFMESRFAYDFSRVRVHTDSQAAESARAVNARAYTFGQNVVFGSGEYAPATSSGRYLLVHELAHVVQQSRGGTTTPSPLRDSPLERSAHQAASSFTQGSGPIHVVGASAPGLARQPRSLAGSLNPRRLANEELQQEISLLREWLRDNPWGSSQKDDLLGELKALDNEVGRRRRRIKKQLSTQSFPEAEERKLREESASLQADRMSIDARPLRTREKKQRRKPSTPETTIPDIDWSAIAAELAKAGYDPYQQQTRECVAASQGVNHEKWSPDLERRYRKRGDTKAANAIRACCIYGGKTCSWLLTDKEAWQAFQKSKGSGQIKLSGMVAAATAPSPTPPTPSPPVSVTPRNLPGGPANKNVPIPQGTPANTNVPASSISPAAANLAAGAPVLGYLALGAAELVSFAAFQHALIRAGYIILADPLAICIGECHTAKPTFPPKPLPYPIDLEKFIEKILREPIRPEGEIFPVPPVVPVPKEKEKKRKKKKKLYPLCWPVQLGPPTWRTFVRVKAKRDTGEAKQARMRLMWRQFRDPAFDAKRYHVHHVNPLFLGGFDDLKTNAVLLERLLHLRGHGSLAKQPQMRTPPPGLPPLPANLYKHPVGTPYELKGFKERADEQC